MTAVSFEEAWLVALSGPATGEVFHLCGNDITLGRDAGNGVPIADPSLSRQHCALSKRGTHWNARDLGSFNGTFVNGIRITETALSDGDTIKAGDSQLLFRTAGPDSASPATGGRPVTAMPAITRLRLEDSAYLRAELGTAAPLPGSSRTQRDLQALVRIGTIINRVRDRDTLQRELIDAAFAIVPAEQAALFWVDAEDPEPQVAYMRNRGALPLGFSRTVIAEAIARVEAILSTDPAADDAFKRSVSIADAHLSSVLAVPLLLEKRVAGLIYLSTSDPYVRFEQMDLELLTALAGIGAVALENVRRIEWLVEETERLKADLDISHDLVGDSAPMQSVYQFIRKVARTDSTVLIRGETGTGKELAARALHANSHRAQWPFVAINCAALTEPLLENELFGHERGAFTDAREMKRGKLEVADRGTVFLDEIGELPPALQAKLLRVLQERQFERVGGTRPVKVDIRVISATNRDLRQAVTTGTFRQDLFFRLNVLTIDMPPLRERRQDIPRLAAHFATKLGARAGRRITGITPEAQRCLRAYDWPGNVRELENAIERAIVLGDRPEIGPEDLPDALLDAGSTTEPSTSPRFHTAITEAKKRIILDAIQRTDGRLTDAAQVLGLHPNYLHRLLNTLNLRPQLTQKPPSADEDR